jgi:hypothetical protein
MALPRSEPTGASVGPSTVHHRIWPSFTSCRVMEANLLFAGPGLLLRLKFIGAVERTSIELFIN